MTVNNVEVINDVTQVTVTQAPAVNFTVTQASPTNVEVATAGLQGPAGGAWFNGTAPPSVGIGANGDYYVVTSGSGLGDVYRKNASNIWVLQGNIRGAAGNVTATGTLIAGNLVSVNNASGIVQDAGVAASNVVTLSSTQTITGLKTFSGSNIAFTGNLTLSGDLVSAASTPLTSLTNTTLGGTAGDFLITKQHTHVGATNQFKNITFMVRSGAGTDWSQAETWEAIGVDTSFLTPTTSKTWWRRNPNAGTQGFGNTSTERLTINTTGVAVTGNLTVSGTIGGTLLDSALPARLGIYSPVVTNYNSIVETGWARASAAGTNAPEATAAHLIFTQYGADQNTAFQIAYAVGSLSGSASDSKSYIRWKASGTWTGWAKQSITQAEQDARYVSLTANQTVSGNKTFNGTTFSVGGAASFGGGSMEIGRVDGVASTPFIDFHSGATVTDFDTRIIASGGTGASGMGSFTFHAAGGSTFSGGVHPSANATHSLGNTTNRWNYLYGTTIDLSSAGGRAITVNHTSSTADGILLTNLSVGGESPRLFFQSDTGAIAIRRPTAGGIMFTSGAVPGTSSGPTVILTISDAGAATFLSTVSAGGTGFTGGGANITGVVHTSSNETIAGTKTFTSGVVIGSTGTPIVGSALVAYSNNSTPGLVVNNPAAGANGVGSTIAMTSTATGLNLAQISSVWSNFAVGDANLNLSVRAGGTLTSKVNINPNGMTVTGVVDATSYFGSALSMTGVVHDIGNETVAGNKTFSNQMIASGIQVGLTQDLTNGYAQLSPNNVTFNRTGNISYIDQTGIGGSIRFRLSNSTVYDTTAFTIASSGMVTFNNDINSTNFQGPGAITHVKVMTQANDTLSGLAARDGYTPVAGDLILVASQTNAAENGVYTAASGAWSRASNYNTAPRLAGATLYVDNGTGAGNTWKCAIRATHVLGTQPFFVIPVYDGAWRGYASGIAGIDSNSLLYTANMGTGTASSGSFLRGDRTWVSGSLVPDNTSLHADPNIDSALGTNWATNESSAGGTVTRDTTTFYNGTGSIKMSTTSTIFSNARVQSTAYDVVPGQIVEVGCWAKALSLTGEPKLYLDANFAVSGTPVMLDYIALGPHVLLTTTWRRYSFKTVVPPGMTRMRPIFAVNSNVGSTAVDGYIDATWSQIVTDAIPLPASGTPGQILKKSSFYDYDATWVTPTEGVWTNYTPNMPNVPVTTTFARYMIIGKTLYLRAAGSIAGSIGGQWLIDLPLGLDFGPGAIVGGGDQLIVGRVRAIRNGVAWYQGDVAPYSVKSGPTAARLSVWNPITSGAVWTNTFPAAWATGDRWSFDIQVEIA